ncbi:MAG: 3-phosphoglycerate dehydrogenase [Gemmatales bacterium]|nr:MAG: 3-phosphoglycerate dehydrogenase [Gemmatales bacterium]
MPKTNVKVVIPADHPPQLQGSPHLSRLKEYAEVELYSDRPLSDEEKVRRARDAEVLLNSRGNVRWPADVLKQLPKLKMITTCGIGTDAFDLEYCQQRGIIVCNIPGATAGIVAEHSLALMLAVARQAWFQTNELKAGRWTVRPNLYLRGRTIGLVGAGSIAVEKARLARAIGMHAIAWTFHPTELRAREMGVHFVSLEELLKTSDVVSVHVKLTEQSRGLIGKKEIAMMKPNAILVNTARGAVVDYQALADAINEGRIAGAGVDVYEVEPIDDNHPLLSCSQVVLTPHNADDTVEGRDLLNQGAVDNVIAYLEGRPRNRVV